MKVLSLFDGMSCGQIALDQLGIKVDTYYASEIDKYGIEITQKNYPNTVQVGDITKLDPKDFQDVDLIMGGSPCQGFSFAGKQLAFDDPRSALFFEFIRMLKAIKPKYFLLENVRMKKEFLDIISQQVSECYPEITFGIQPILINSSLVSAQSRQRYYWTNIPNIEQPEERGIVLKDILENDFSSEKDKSYCIDANYFKGASVEQYKKKSRRQLVSKPKKAFDIPRDILKDNEMRRGVYSSEGKSPTIISSYSPKIKTKPKQVGGAFRGRAYDKDGKRMDRDGSSVANKTKQMLELRKDDKSNAITTVGKDSVVVDEELTWRKLTPLECERLQTVPDNYTEGVSNTQRYKMLGNGWTVEVIKHILGYME
jgi:DNA-cytosine methyltransferase